MAVLLLILAIIIGAYGVSRIVNGDPFVGALLIVLALAVGPGGFSIFH